MLAHPREVSLEGGDQVGPEAPFHRVGGLQPVLLQKVGEEAVEVALASVAGEREELLDESADLLYHLLVMLRASGVPLADVVAAIGKVEI